MQLHNADCHVGICLFYLKYPKKEKKKKWEKYVCFLDALFSSKPLSSARKWLRAPGVKLMRQLGSQTVKAVHYSLSGMLSVETYYELYI